MVHRQIIRTQSAAGGGFGRALFTRLDFASSSEGTPSLLDWPHPRGSGDGCGALLAILCPPHSLLGQKQRYNALQKDNRFSKRQDRISLFTQLSTVTRKQRFSVQNRYGDQRGCYPFQSSGCLATPMSALNSAPRSQARTTL